jgi:hypothetical protein
MTGANTKRELVEEVWRASNLTWREADRIISEAMTLGRAEYHQHGPAHTEGAEIIRRLAA